VLLERWVSRGFLRPSHQFLPCAKAELLIEVPWGRVQVWREYSGGSQTQSRPPQLYFLRFLGSRGRAEMATLDPADRLGDVPAEVWTVNPPGFGATSGPASLERYADCAEAAITELRRHAGSRPIWTCGKSIGTTAAMHVAVSHDIAGLILRNVLPLRELLRRRYAIRTAGISRFAIAPMIPSRLDSIANARKATAPAIFLVSARDSVAPPAYQREIISAYRGATTVLEVAGDHDEPRLQADDEAAYRQLIATHVTTGHC
jgi:uncharacterized protein